MRACRVLCLTTMSSGRGIRRRSWKEIVEIVDSIKAGNAALKALNLDADEVQAVMDESAEAVARQREIDTITGSTPRA
jgi:hypothetical protein